MDPPVFGTLVCTGMRRHARSQSPSMLLLMPRKRSKEKRTRVLFLLSSHSPSVHPSPPGVGGTITSDSRGPSLTLSLEATAHLLPARAQNGGHFITRPLKTQLKTCGLQSLAFCAAAASSLTHSYIYSPRGGALAS